jgi:octaprenyl-diphosphate synthase
MNTYSLKEIQRPIETELATFHEVFKKSLKSQVSLLDHVMGYILKSKGKQIRPLFVFLCAKLFDNCNESTYRAASLVELLHTATLVHDDVVDDSFQRRGFWSINALWKNKIAVLVGDYLLSRGLLLALDNGEFALLQIMSKAVKDMSEGELLQIEKARKLDISEEVYYDIITKKTASLISAACAAGAATTTKDPEQIELIKLFGIQAGIAFQIRDDLFDYGGHGQAGKPVMNDLKEQKMTLPLIVALKKASKSENQKIINLVKKNKKSADNIQTLIDFVKKHNGIQIAKEAMEKHRHQALQIIAPLPPSEAKEALEKLLHFVIDRNN